jgi:tetratricopeptide (TPR) repeat protein
MAPRKKPRPAPRKKSAAPKRPAASRPRPKPPAEAPGNGGTLPIDLQPGRIEEALKKVTETLRHWANTGRYTKVRFKFRGKPLLPDLPLAAVVAAEGLTFYWTGILRALLVNVAGRSVLDVELVNDAEHHVQKGKEELLAGEVDRAIAEFRYAIAKQRDNASAHLNLGVALKLKGDKAGAKAALEKARALDPEGPMGKEAERVLQGLGSASDIGSGGF